MKSTWRLPSYCTKATKKQRSKYVSRVIRITSYDFWTRNTLPSFIWRGNFPQHKVIMNKHESTVFESFEEENVWLTTFHMFDRNCLYYKHFKWAEKALTGSSTTQPHLVFSQVKESKHMIWDRSDDSHEEFEPNPSLILNRLNSEWSSVGFPIVGT